MMVRNRPRWFASALGVVAAGIALAPLFHSRAVTLGLLIAIVAISLSLIGIGLHSYRPAHRLPWYQLAAGFVAFAIGMTVSKPLDALFALAGYALIGLAALSWVRPRRVGRDLLLDSTMIGSSALLAAWIFLISPIFRHGNGLDALLAACFPVVDALLLTLLAHTMATAARSEKALRVLQVALLAALIGGLFESGAAAGFGWAAVEIAPIARQFAILLAGIAALHPTMVDLGNSADVQPHRARRRAGAIAVALVAASLVSVVGTNPGPADRIVVCGLLTLLLVGVLVRSEHAIARSARSERRAQYQADHDQLTGLLNRAALLRAPQVHRGEWTGKPLSLLFIDLDDFKRVNDSYGHAVGDELIAAVACRITDATRDSDVTARYGGDEFVVLCARGRADAHALAQQLLGAFIRPFDLSCGELPITASIGIATTGARLASAHTGEATVYALLRDADAAMYHAKEFGLGLAVHDEHHRPRRRRVIAAVDPSSTAV
ncbi:GGDEF domain-containing protein [Nocardia camponoti]|uniref:GGDEF domain-containing protein n=1 Tax=Nocardia camponoti TaxID=1616106 RepID=A0A917V6M5_9NOCA|nr:GGDEF domain-containing protein [Nocardia camponoti]GGK45150.1 hypothetical protein GCM10011591_15960 [Nocardia camponoti]